MLGLIGSNHQFSSQDFREKLVLNSEEKLHHFNKSFTQKFPMGGWLLLSTCNRIEFYLELPPHSPLEEFKDFFYSYFECDREKDPSKFYLFQDKEVVDHLFKVIASLDSMIYGENQIQSQIKTAYESFLGKKGLGKTLDRLFKAAIEAGKAVRHETPLGKNMVSISSAGVQLAQKIFGPLHEARVLVIGAGEMSELTIRHLKDHSIKELWITNRSPNSAEELAQKFGGKTLPFKEFVDFLDRVDIVISQTASPHLILDRSQMESCPARRGFQPLFLIDIALPRDISPACGDLENVFLFNLDHLQRIVQLQMGERGNELEQVLQILNREKLKFFKWNRGLRVVPLIQKWKTYFSHHRDEEFEKLKKRCSHLSPEDLKWVEKGFHQLTNRLLHQPLSQVKKSFTDESEEGVNLGDRLEGFIENLFEMEPPAPTDLKPLKK